MLYMYSRQQMKPPVGEIDLNAPMPAYRQIVDRIRQFLVDGSLAEGDALPSVRKLAADLGVHHNTVAEAYRTLAEEGWLDIAQGKAVRVTGRAAQPALPRREQEELARSFERRMRELAAEARARGLSAAMLAGRLRLLAEEVD